jgi:hypothetical protein
MNDSKVRSHLIKADEQAHRAEQCLNQIEGVELTTDQWIARAAAAAQLAAADALCAVAITLSTR